MGLLKKLALIPAFVGALAFTSPAEAQEKIFFEAQQGIFSPTEKNFPEVMPAFKLGFGGKSKNFEVEFYASYIASINSLQYNNLELGSKISTFFGEETDTIQPYIGVQISTDMVKEIGIGAGAGAFAGLNFSLSKNYSIFLEGDVDYIPLITDSNSNNTTTNENLVSEFLSSPKTNFGGVSITLGVKYTF